MSNQEPEAPPLRLDMGELEAGDLEDIAEYAGRDDAIGLVFGAFEAAEDAAPGQELHAMFTKLPPKVFTALLGVARRHNDPGWTPEHWRKFRISDLAPASGDGSDPTSAGHTPGSTSAAWPSGARTRRPQPNATGNGSAGTPR